MTALSAASLDFLADLAANNNKEWFAGQRDRYEAAKADVVRFAGGVLDEVMAFDPRIPVSLQARKCVLRLHRDVRFSRNKLPYKTNFGIGISRFGSKFVEPGYYVHIAPQGCFIGGGWWCPEAAALKAIRATVAEQGDELQRIVTAPGFVAAFGGLDREEVLKTAPKGYAKDHPQIELLKLKSYTASQPVPADYYLRPDAARLVGQHLAALQPLVEFLRRAAPAPASIQPGLG
ncbi:DUF2461 domain-containing protein [Chitinilyticum aquatile]|uniref:DUF2461 domain-containing protein n=1 Tax=Chitinilyticum aquatile TaxID=362520 RepID=UPI00040E2080|nr:DUF2461 domain-containing protein [Chitinilyticum aquatile]